MGMREEAEKILKKAKEKRKLTYGELATELDDANQEQIEKIFDKPVLKFKQGMYQVQGSCVRLREEIIEKIEKAIELSLAENI